MTFRGFHAAALAALLLPGCAAQDSGRNAVAAADFRCPLPGTRTTSTRGTTNAWLRQEEGKPICVVRTVSGPGTTERRLAFNYWEASNVDDAVVVGTARLFPLAIGKSSAFNRTGTDAGRQTPVTYRERWRVLRREPIEVAGRARSAWVLERVSSMDSLPTGASETEFLIWIDEQTGVVLKQTVNNLRGLWRGAGPFEVVALETP